MEHIMQAKLLTDLEVAISQTSVAPCTEMLCHGCDE